MTTIEFGGGPVLEARRQFISLKSGGEIPNYAGHVHQLRFNQGHTFTEETHRVATDFPQVPRRSAATAPMIHYNQPDPYETRDFPDGKIPGYAGYIPQRKFHHGQRYRVETDACSVSTKSSYEDRQRKSRDLHNEIKSYPKTQRLNSGTVVKHFLDYHRAHYPEANAQQDDRRSLVEAPIPGYKGYIPRLIPFNLGVGTRYHNASQESLDRFAFETTHSTTNFSELSSGRESLVNLDLNTNNQRPVSMSAAHRIYKGSGMIPRYAGYIPQRKYRCGQTFGDTTRGLPVCSGRSSTIGRSRSLHQPASVHIN